MTDIVKADTSSWTMTEVIYESAGLSFRARVAITSVYVALFLFGVLGNLVAVRVVWILKQRTCIKKSVGYHMLSLALSDLLILVVGIPTELYSIIWYPFPWRLGSLGCKGFYYLWETCSFATIFNILAFSLERYLVTCHPLRAKIMSRSRTKKLVLGVWLLSLLSGIPTLISVGLEDGVSPFRGTEEDSRPPVLVCTNISAQKNTFQALVCTSFVLYIMVLLCVAFTCWQIIQALQGCSSSVIVKCHNGSVHQLSKIKDTDGLGARRQNAMMLGCIVLVLAVCWLPFQCRRLMTALRWKEQWTEQYYLLYITLQPISNGFYYLSSSINPLLYNVTSSQFRAVLSQWLWRSTCRETTNTSRRSSQCSLVLQTRHRTFSAPAKPDCPSVYSEGSQ
ncbi:GPR39 protein, partial [Polypterus senegalus]|nr:G-protein coupled receptor 39-like [Polypterus senegalus]MBN3293811.1 GPR39 protein [Polypterus senegalus]